MSNHTLGALGQSSMGGQGAFMNQRESMSQRRPMAANKKLGQNYQRYMDKMTEALNKNIEKNIFPYWRNH